MDQASFKPERFRVELQSSDAGTTTPVVVQVALDGFKVLSDDGYERTMRKYPLNLIRRWEVRGRTMNLYTKTPSDPEERVVTFQGDTNTVRSLLDTLTSSCMQICELLGSGEMAGGVEAANQLSSLVKGGGRKKSSKSQTVAEDVEFWHGADKEGWLYSQGEIVKTWRRRFFVLKQGFLFRFSTADLDRNSKPRGIVNLQDVTDISDGQSVTGKKNSLRLSTAAGHICYHADSDTDLMEWMSVLDKVLSDIVKRAAGVDEDDEFRPSRGRGRSDKDASDLMHDLMQGYDQLGGGRNREKMVNVVGYDSFSATAPPAAPTPGNSDSSNSGQLRYGDIDGIAGIVHNTPSNLRNPVVSVNYGGQLNNEPQQHVGPQQHASPHQSSTHASSTVQGGYAPQNNRQPYPNQYSGVYPSASIIDQPQQQPSYPAFQSAHGNHMVSSTINPNPWQVFFTPDGKAYYHNQATGHVQWERPAELTI